MSHPSIAPRRMRPLLPLLLALAAPALGAQGAPTFSNPPTLPPSRGYSQVVEVPPGARTVIVSGQVALDSTGQLVGGSDFRAQTVQVFENLRRALASRGARMGDIVKFTFYVLDAKAHLATLREVRDQYVNVAAPPASTLVQVGALFRPDVLLEVEATAVVPPAPPTAAPAPAAPPLPSVTLPPALDRVLRDYEAAWRAGDAAALAALFTDDGFVLQGGQPPVRGRAAIQRAYAGQGGAPLALRALAGAAGDAVGYIIGAYGYGDGRGDVGKFTLTLRKVGGRWRIASDMDNLNTGPRD